MVTTLERVEEEAATSPSFIGKSITDALIIPGAAVAAVVALVKGDDEAATNAVVSDGTEPCWDDDDGNLSMGKLGDAEAGIKTLPPDKEVSTMFPAEVGRIIPAPAKVGSETEPSMSDCKASTMGISKVEEAASNRSGFGDDIAESCNEFTSIRTVVTGV